MDYKDKYLKYKQKYLSLKNSFQSGGGKILKIDHIMFPIYNNNNLLDEIKEEWKKNKNYIIKEGKQNPTFKGIYLQGKDFYIEHLSTTKSNYYWTNSLAIILDKKYWSYYKNPVLIDDNFMTPEFGCGYFFVNPEYKFTHQNINESNYNNFTILISKNLKKELEKIAGIKWTLPKYMKTDKRLCQKYDIFVMDGNKMVSPLFQANQQYIE